jgi:hypothetical protein
MKKRSVAGVAVLLAACAGPGPHGYARTYAPAAGEEDATRDAVPLDPAMLGEPALARGRPVALFGVVQRRGAASKPTDGVVLVVDLRRLEDRNLCESAQSERTCRVTVSDASFGTTSVVVQLATEDDAGEHAVGPGSLVRVVGAIGTAFDETGAPLVKATWYRHWPHGQYVTRAEAAVMRQ